MKNNQIVLKEKKKDSINLEKIVQGIGSIAQEVTQLKDSYSDIMEKKNDSEIIKNERLKIQAEALLKSQQIQKQHTEVMENMNQHYAQQKQAMKLSSDIIEAALKNNDIAVLKEGIKHSLGTIENSFSSDNKKRNNIDEETIEL